MPTVSQRPTPEPKTINCAKQYVAGVVSCIGAFCFGTAVGWMNYGGRVEAERRYAHGPQMDKWKLTGLMLPVGAACFCMPVGLLIKRYGCRTMMLLQLLPYCVGWLLLIFARNVYMVYVARYLLGICGAALCIAVPMYNAEITQLQQRGSIVSLFHGALVYGIVFNNLMAAFLGIQLSNVFCLLVALPNALLLFIPELPSYLLSRGRVEQAEASVRWLRGSSAAKNLSYSAMSSDGIGNKRHLRSWPRSAMLLLLYQATGGLIINTHLLDMMARIHTRFTVYLDCIYVSLCVGYLICFLLVDRLGRLTILLISSASMCLCSLYLWIWSMWLKTDGWRWLPIISFVLFIGFFSMGVGPLTWIMYVELIAEPVRPLGCAIAATISWAAAALLNIRYSYLLSSQATFLFILIGSILGLIFIIVFIPETRGLESSQIQNILANRVFRERHSSDESL